MNSSRASGPTKGAADHALIFMLRLYFQLLRWLLIKTTKPSISGEENLRFPHPDLVVDPQSRKAPWQVVYVIQRRSVLDLLALETALIKGGLAPELEENMPLSPLELGTWRTSRRSLALERAFRGRITMRRHSRRLRKLIAAPMAVQENVLLVPVSIFWGRSLAPRGSWIKALTSDQRSATAGFKRMVTLILNRGDIHICFGSGIALSELATHPRGEDYALRRAARLLRVRFKAQHRATLGPDFSHRRTLLNSVVASAEVQASINALVEEGGNRWRLERQANKMVRTIASDMTYSIIRFFLIFLAWFWARIYSGIDIRGLTPLTQASETHTLVYVPSHRSHIDYLVLSYALYRAGIMIPHIAAGDNLNLPLVGRFLRGGGAFFMRRSFRDDPLYTATFSEYLFQVYDRGHCVEFFPEGGRSRSGRLLSVKYGLLKQTLTHQLRGLSKPLAFVPVYFGYEKVIEGNSYLREMMGAEKRGESTLDILKNLRLIRQNFGRLRVSLGKPIALDQWLEEQPSAHEDNAIDASPEVLKRLGARIMREINAQATLNPVNILALTLRGQEQIQLDQGMLLERVERQITLARRLYSEDILTAEAKTAVQCLDTVVDLGFLDRKETPLGITISQSRFTAKLIGWYRNNVLNRFVLPALVAHHITTATAALKRSALETLLNPLYPLLAAEYTAPTQMNLNHCLNVLEQLGLIIQDQEGIRAAEPKGAPFLMLTNLAALVEDSLQRLFIVIEKAEYAPKESEGLRTASLLALERLSVLEDAPPDFADPRLLQQLIVNLVEQGLLTEDGASVLSPSPDALRLADRLGDVFPPDIRPNIRQLIGTDPEQTNIEP